MKKTWLIIVLAAIVLGGGVWWFLTNKATAPSLPSATPASEVTTDSSQSAEDVRSGTVNITMQNIAFSLASVKIKKGTKVIWTNQDSVRHNVVADGNNTNGLPTDNELVGKGQTYEFTFNTVGTVKYHCTPHPGMTGTIEVVE